ncbi:MAG: hypothetical protein PHH37_08370 [Paludibacter sp.]|nr:hypothetical protein [Paludibacter sp.]
MTKSEYKDLLERFRAKSEFIRKATINTIIRETDEEQGKRIDWLFKPDNYGEMFNYYFGKETTIPMADSDCAWYHTSIYKDLYYNNFITLFNLIFRGGAKSTHANMGYAFGLKQTKKAMFQLVVGANEVRAAMLLQDLQVQFECNERIIKDFGIQKSYGNWAEGQFETTDRCTFMALGIDQPFRGLRQNGVRLEYTSLDDLEDKKKSLNKSLVKEYADKVTGDIQGAFSINSERAIINNNYFTEKGLIYELAKRKGFDLKKIDTKQNVIRKEKYASLYIVNLTTKYYDQLNQTTDWEPSWKERYSKPDCIRKVEQYEHDKETLSGEFYNTPINAGKRIKKEWIRMVKPKPFDKYIVIVGNWDFAYSDKACYKAMATIGVRDLHMTVVDIYCRQTADIETALQYHYTQANKTLKINGSIIFYYDASVSQEAVYEPILIRAAQKYKSICIPMPQKSVTDKYTKIDTTLVSVLFTGILDFSEELENNPDWEEAKAQMLNFEKGGNYPVDFPDSLTDAILKAQEYLNNDVEDENNKVPVMGEDERGGY